MPADPRIRYDCLEAMAPPAGTSWAALLELVPAGATVLDVGCSTGSFAVALKRKGCRVTGVEVNAAAAEVAKTRCDEVLVGDVAALLATEALRDTAFDVVVAADVLEHLVDPHAVVRALRRIVRPGGALLASLPNVTHAAVVLEMCRGRFPIQPEGLLDATHLHFFGEDSAVALFTDAGFTAEIAARVRRAPQHTEFRSEMGGVPDAVLEFLDRNPNADTYQFIIRAVPAGAAAAAGPPPADPSDSPLRNSLVREIDELRTALRQYHEAAVGRDGDIAALNDRVKSYHEALVAKDADLAALHDRLREYHEAALVAEREQARLGASVEALRVELDDVRARHRERELVQRALLREVVPRDLLRVLYVTDSWDAPARYRCQHAVLQLRLDGVLADVIGVDDPELLDAVPGYSIVVLFRLPWSERVEAVVALARSRRITLVFDIDDLVFDTGAEALLHFFEDLPPALQRQYLELFPRLRRTFDACDHFVGSTPVLARAAAALGKEAFVHPNLVSDTYVRQSRLIRAVRALRGVPPTIAYLSGSNTHDRDLATIAGALARLLDEDPARRLLVCGFVNLPDDLVPFSSQITHLPYQDWRVYPWALARCRVTVAPIAAVNAFTDAKSPLKFFEAGVFGVPTVATPTAAFREAITDGENGFLATDETEWVEKIHAALDARHARALGERARATVLARYTFAAHRGRLCDLLRPLVQSRPGPPPRRRPLGPRREPGAFDVRRRQWAIFRGRLPDSQRNARSAVPPQVSPLQPGPFERVLATIEEHGPSWLGIVRPVSWHAADRAALDRWTPDGAIRRRPEGGYESTGADPRLVGPSLCVRTADFRYLVVRLAVAPSRVPAVAQFFWLAEGTAAFSEEDSVRWCVDHECRTYAIDLAETAWRRHEVVRRLRLDPLDCPGNVAFEGVWLLADLAQLHPDAEPAAAFVQRYARGRGVACGDAAGLALPTAAVRVETTGAPPAAGADRVVLADPTRLPIRSAWADYCVAPLGDAGTAERLGEALRVVRPGGAVLVPLGSADPGGARRSLAETCDRIDAVVDEVALGVLWNGTNDVAAVRRRTAATEREPWDHIGARRRRGVDVVVPVYNARKETIACIESVIRHARGDWRLIVVDDASTDESLVAWLNALRDPRVLVLRNARNLGFVATANRGMREAAGRDVLLLNSDTIVGPEFLERLQDCAYADPRTGIVCPLSNNATICSVPEFCRANAIPAGHTVDSFAELVATSSLRLRPELVTAVGFCMYVRCDVLAQVGRFDEKHFPRGYGEENDFSERALAAGFTIRLADDVFVYHAGEASFAAETGTLRGTNDATLERLHPGYFAKVARFIAENPLAAVHENLRLAIRRRTARQPALLVLLHASFERPGGGTEHHVRDLVAAVRLPRVVVAVPAGDALELTEVVDGAVDDPIEYRVPVACPLPRFNYDAPEVEATLQRIVRLFGVGAVHVHHLLNWPITAWRAFKALGLPVVYTAHDYYCICPSLNLIDVVTGAGCCAAAAKPRDPAACLAHLHESLDLPPPADPDGLLARHREEFGRLLSAARMVVFPSAAARDLVGRVHALAPDRACVIPHGQAGLPHRPGPAQGGPVLRVALLGQIAHRHKGAREYLALIDRTRHLPLEWHIFGETDFGGYDGALDALGLGPRLVQHGRYERDEIRSRLVAERIDVAVFLPIWPETFCYTLSEALGAGVPVVAAAQGALPERVRAAGAGAVVDGVEEAAAVLARLVADPPELARLKDAAAAFDHPSIDEMADRYRTLYAELLALAPRPTSPGPAMRRELLTAHRGAAAAATTPAATVDVLPHYGRWWYPAYARLAPLVPARLRRWGRDRVARRRWRPIHVCDFAHPNGVIERTDGLELVRAGRRGATYRVVDGDPAFVLRPDPFPTRDVRLIRFEMRCRVPRAAFAQLYWTHTADEHFSEEKSVQVPVDGTEGKWQEYCVQIDQSDRRERWDAGSEIHRLRFDPLNVPSRIELRTLSFCARADGAS